MSSILGDTVVDVVKLPNNNEPSVVVDWNTWVNWLYEFNWKDKDRMLGWMRMYEMEDIGLVTCNRRVMMFLAPIPKLMVRSLLV